VAQNTTVSDTYRGIGDSIGRYSGILIPGIGSIDRKTDINKYLHRIYITSYLNRTTTMGRKRTSNDADLVQPD
jgi:hypothetical protein